MKIVIILVIVLCTFTSNIYSQSRKKAEKLGIKSVTEIKVDYEDSNGDEIIRRIKVFDENGNVIEDKDYNRAGKLQEKITYEYNGDNELIKEVHYRPNNKVQESFTYKYRDGLIVERCKYDSNNRLLWKRKYVYKFSDE
jgi:hypothetical protein